MSRAVPEFREPGGVERLFNKLFGVLVGLGLAPRYNYLLQVHGRRTGRVYSTPVNVLELRGKRFLVAPPRPRATSFSSEARAAGASACVPWRATRSSTS